ncbi:di-trans,poly-cis-decaprenylcistransferase [Schaalia turicensis ACS-279-V-Col4]|uniref:Isoprenyl transferase n=1 Tax=Schaalia turicensis ACS-279-V-Col4 TaxID=883077 RepID=K0YQ94_9ACTO|nr:isoprenyl transferase [Schaalia turicensis]EJZ85646.1 di-trans,poly-cis-decaprenylcistransferase [Schaalia turicensis ACS-279-V-Col4]MDU7382640.1 isoprenyl transferase [Schaalia turicensis]
MARLALAYDLYEERLRKQLPQSAIPRHIGVILDGNRRWAKSTGKQASQGHRAGADKISEFLVWAEELGVEVITLWMLSTDNLSRTSEELTELLGIIADAVDHLAMQGKWHLNVVGDLGLLPEDVAARIRASVASTATVRGMKVNVAVGYGGRHEITEAVRAIMREASAQGKNLDEVADCLSDADITAHLYTKDQPDPDLVIRTSGEQRLSGFMIWQSVHSEYYFCEAYWPDFRRVDFLRALRSYAQRERRLGK